MATKTYKTVSGDTWDMIAYKVYGDSMKVAPLMDANPEELDTLIFSSDTVIIVPDIEETQEEYTYPDWRS